MLSGRERSWPSSSRACGRVRMCPPCADVLQSAAGRRTCGPRRGRLRRDRRRSSRDGGPSSVLQRSAARLLRAAPREGRAEARAPGRGDPSSVPQPAAETARAAAGVAQRATGGDARGGPATVASRTPFCSNLRYGDGGAASPWTSPRSRPEAAAPTGRGPRFAARRSTSLLRQKQARPGMAPVRGGANGPVEAEVIRALGARISRFAIAPAGGSAPCGQRRSGRDFEVSEGLVRRCRRAAAGTAAKKFFTQTKAYEGCRFLWIIPRNRNFWG